MKSQPTQRIQKLLANAGHGSRRKIEALIREGRITVDGKPALIGQPVTGAEKIRIDKKPIKPISLSESEAQHHYLIYHKPVDEICTRNDPEGRPSVYKRLPPVADRRWISVGRLDINSSGLMLFTTDGALANKLMHPSSAIDREYAVRVLGDVGGDIIERLQEGVMLEDGIARFTDIQKGSGQGANQWYYVVIQEGRNREVRRLWQSQDITVSRLMRVRYGPVILQKSLRPGRWKYLELSDIDLLYQAAELPFKPSMVNEHARKRANEKPGSHTRTVYRKKKHQ
ncbi:MAG: pseudouridine synthase [Gammaproteobacteria bacterium]